MTYVPKPRTVEIEAPADVAPFAEGSEPFRATVRVDTTVAQFASLSRQPPTWGERKERYAPFVVAWNIEEAPPAEAGMRQFDMLDVVLARWLVEAVITAITDEQRKQIAAFTRAEQQQPKLSPDAQPDC